VWSAKNRTTHANQGTRDAKFFTLAQVRLPKPATSQFPEIGTFAIAKRGLDYLWGDEEE
jgi:hypothetical protein